MTKTYRAALFLCLVIVALASFARAQSGPQAAPQSVLVQGLLSGNHRGHFVSAAFGPDGSLYLLLDQDDGVRVLRRTAGVVQTEFHSVRLGTRVWHSPWIPAATCM